MSGPVVPENNAEVKPPIDNSGSFHTVNNQAGEAVTVTQEADIEARATLHKELETLGTTPPPSPDSLSAPIPDIKAETTSPETPKPAEDSSWALQINQEKKEKQNAA